MKRLSKAQIPELVARLRQRYPGVVCALDHRNAFELIIATILSAQTTDKRVNMVTPGLFERFPTPAALAAADQAEVEALVKTTGFFRNKAKSIIGCARGLLERHGGEVPKTLEELIELPGVARKTANVVLGSWYRVAVGVVVDTHVLRISKLLGLTDNDDAVKVERDLMEQLPREDWIDFSHMVIHHGRQICIARRPLCDQCPLNTLCVSAFDPKAGYKLQPEVTPVNAEPALAIRSAKNAKKAKVSGGAASAKKRAKAR